MSDTAQARQFHYIAPPTYGGIVRLQATVTAQAIDLTAMAGWPGNQTSAGSGAGQNNYDPNPIGHYVTIEVDGPGTIWIVFADTYAHATGIDTTTTSTATGAGPPAGEIDGKTSAAFTAKGATAVGGGSVLNYWIPPGLNPQTTPFGASSLCRFFGFITNTGTVNFVIRQSSH